MGCLLSRGNSAKGREHGTACRPSGAVAPVKRLSARCAGIDIPAFGRGWVGIEVLKS